MGFFKKLGDLARSNLSNLLDQLEDPKKMAEQAVIDLKESKDKALKLLIKAQAQIKLLEQKLLKLRDDATLLLHDAEQMLTKADEENARALLLKKQAITHEKSFYEQELIKEQQGVDTLKRGLKAIDERIAELKLSAKDIGMNVINKTDAFDGFARMEEKIVDKEYELDALNELLKLDEQAIKKETGPASFDKHSDPEALEKELLAIKNKLNS